MSLDYEKLKKKQSDAEGSFWTSYSDLFMVLSVVFLFLYVVTSLRTGTNNIQNQLEAQRLKSEVEDLKKQIQAYNALKDDYLKKEASEEEVKMYEDLMGKLSLLQDEAQQEKKKLENQAQENEAKAEALNQYQQMVRNIVNTNLLSNKKIKFRNEVIEKKNDEIKELDQTITVQTEEIQDKAKVIAANENLIKQQDTEIKDKQMALESKRQEVETLSQEVKEKSQVIQNNQAKINNLNSDLEKKISELENTSTAAKMSKAELSKKIVMMKLENAKKVSELQKQEKEAKDGLQNVNQQLQMAQGQLDEAKGKISEQEAIKAKLEGDIAKANAEYQQKMSDMRNEFDQKMDAERKALEGQLEKEKASAAEKAKRLADFKGKMDAEKSALDKQLADLKGQVGKAQEEADEYKKKLGDAKKEHDRYLAAIGDLQKANAGLSGDLKRAQEMADAKKKLARKIADNLAKKGIKAGVDGKSGDVTIEFGDEYFDTDRSDLKPNMKAILEKFVPTYSKSLLEDEKVAKEISSVEIIGFSSPTYRGRFIDPQSLADEDRTAVNYNLDLSYNRAKSIFSYMFDTENMTYQYQKELLPLVKVTGRSFLAEEVKGRSIASGLSHKEYCAKYKCEKSQKVIIRFNMKD